VPADLDERGSILRYLRHLAKITTDNSAALAEKSGTPEAAIRLGACNLLAAAEAIEAGKHELKTPKVVH
jgi:hypothetical protein